MLLFSRCLMPHPFDGVFRKAIPMTARPVAENDLLALRKEKLHSVPPAMAGQDRFKETTEKCATNRIPS